MSIVVNPGATIHLVYQAEDKETGLTIACTIYDSADTALSTPTMTHIANGRYTGTTAIGNEGSYSAIFTPSDANYATTHEAISVQHSWRPSMGAAPEAVISEKVLDPLLKEIKELQEELRKKSEFNPNKQKVLTDIKIPPFSLRTVNDKLDNIAKQKQQLNLQPIMQQQREIVKMFKEIVKIFNQIQREISKKQSVDFSPIFTQINSLKGSLKTENPQVVAFLNKIIGMLEVLNQQSTKRDTQTQGLVQRITQMIQPFLNINNLIGKYERKLQEKD